MNRTWRYQPVVSRIWRDTRFRAFTEDGRALALYLLTCPDRTTEGFYSLQRVNLLDDLHWDEGRFYRALVELVDAEFASYDDKAQVAFIAKALKFHPPRGVKSIKGAINVLDSTMDAPTLFGRFLDAADRYAPLFAAAIRERYGI